MNQMNKILMLLCCLVFGANAMAIEVGVIGGYKRNSVTSDDNTYSYSSGNDYEFGALLLVDILPLLQIRTGVISKNVKRNGSVAGVDFTITDNLLDIPIDLELNLPLGLYVYGGVIYSSTQSTSCSAGSGNGFNCTSNTKTPDDLPVNLGVGFDIINMAMFKLGVEAEYQLGTRNMYTSGSSTEKINSLGANVVAKFGF